MPYIITTTRPCGAQFRRCNDPSHADVTRRAVATLDEAKRRIAGRIECLARIAIEDAARLTEQVERLAGSGGTVGPLPDGTVIEVEPCDRFWLLSEMGLDDHSPDAVAEIIAAYNAAQERA